MLYIFYSGNLLPYRLLGDKQKHNHVHNYPKSSFSFSSACAFIWGVI